MTYSIVARDPGTGAMGVAVQSHWFSTGSVVPWAEAGVGAVATQAFAEPSYGPLGLELIRGGKAAADALRALVTTDEAADRRQVAMVDTEGRVATHTGEGCIAEAGHVTGEGFTCQANMMLRDTVPEAMADAYSSSGGELADRFLAALDAAEAEGGDVRGRQSAALLVVEGQSTGRPYADRVLELRVEDHPGPLAELRRLVGVKRSYDRMSRGDELMASGDEEAAAREYAAAQEAVPDNVEFTFWRGVTLATQGRVDEARELLARTRDATGEWDELLRRLPAAGLLPEDLPDRLLS